MAGQKTSGKKTRRAGNGRKAQNDRTKRNVQKRRLKFERRIKAQIEEAGDGEYQIPIYQRGHGDSHRGRLERYESKAERLREHLKWSIGMRQRWN